jgi:hypothetical protein
MAKKNRQSPRKNVTKPTTGPSSTPLPMSSSLKEAIAIGIREISKGASDQQITQSLRDSGIEIKKLPEGFLSRLRSGASFKPKPDRREFRKKSN